jgi:hypothetical protein
MTPELKKLREELSELAARHNPDCSCKGETLNKDLKRGFQEGFDAALLTLLPLLERSIEVMDAVVYDVPHVTNITLQQERIGNKAIMLPLLKEIATKTGMEIT